MKDITPDDSVVPIYLAPFIPEEQAEREKWAEEDLRQEEIALAKQAAKESAIAKLAKLGLTAEEAAAIVGV